MLVNAYQFQMFMMHNFSITPCTCISVHASLTWQNIATSVFANSITFEAFFLVGPLGLGNSEIEIII